MEWFGTTSGLFNTELWLQHEMPEPKWPYGSERISLKFHSHNQHKGGLPTSRTRHIGRNNRGETVKYGASRENNARSTCDRLADGCLKVPMMMQKMIRLTWRKELKCGKDALWVCYEVPMSFTRGVPCGSLLLMALATAWTSSSSSSESS